jgi:hypothetical protein
VVTIEAQHDCAVDGHVVLVGDRACAYCGHEHDCEVDGHVLVHFEQHTYSFCTECDHREPWTDET